MWSFWIGCGLTPVPKQVCRLSLNFGRIVTYWAMWVFSNRPRIAACKIRKMHYEYLERNFLTDFCLKSWREHIWTVQLHYLLLKKSSYNDINQRVKQRMRFRSSIGMTEMRNWEKNMKNLWNYASVCGFCNSNPFWWLKRYMIGKFSFMNGYFQISPHRVKKKNGINPQLKM